MAAFRKVNWVTADDSSSDARLDAYKQSGVDTAEADAAMTTFERLHDARREPAR